MPSTLLDSFRSGADMVPTWPEDVLPIQKITKRTVDAAEPGPKTFLIRDAELKGFVVVITPNNTKSYALDYRTGRSRRARKRRLTIGKHGSPWTPETARKEAFRLLGELALGIDPAERRQAEQLRLTISELCDLYIAEGVAHKKASTLKADRGRIEHHLKPLLGRTRVDLVCRADVERLLVDVSSGKFLRSTSQARKSMRSPGGYVRGGPGAAFQCVTLLGTILAFAVRRGLRPDNPAHGLKKPPIRKMERFLSEAETTRLAAALDAETARTKNSFPSAAIKLLLLTGCRRGEMLGLRWDHVDFERRCLHLPDSKSGSKLVYLNAPAIGILQQLPREADNPYVINGTRKGSPLVGLDKIWFRVRKRAGLADVRMHDLRHSFASVGAVGGVSLPVIGALLGHKHTTTTARYAHLSADPIRAANEAIGAKLNAAMGASIGAPAIEKTHID